MRRLLRFQFIRYVVVGAVNTGFSYGVYAALLFVGLDYRVANLLALLLGILFSFATQGKFVFKNATRVTFAKFVIAWLLIYLVNISIIALFLRAGMSAYLAGACALVPVTLLSYFVLKLAVFRHRNPHC
jgi:putative flippase GtrA